MTATAEVETELLDTCGECGASLKRHRHGLTPNLVAGLRRLHEAGGGPINLKELRLTRNQWDNFQKLRYWNLVRRLGSGVWELSPLGQRFVNGEERVPRRVWTFRGQPIRYEGEPVSISDLTS